MKTRIRPFPPLILSLVLVGCPSGGAPDGGPDLSADLRKPADLLPAAPPDLYGGACAGKQGQRLCSMDQLSSGSCDDTLTFQVDRACQGAGCTGGYCNPPKGGVSCVIDADCKNAGQGNPYCQVFTNEFNVYASFCSPAAGPGAPLSVCQKDSDCQSNICLHMLQTSQCAKPCKRDTDCDGSPGSCGPGTLSVEGFHDIIGVCIK